LPYSPLSSFALAFLLYLPLSINAYLSSLLVSLKTTNFSLNFSLFIGNRFSPVLVPYHNH
jgi:hypothetical protein